MSINTIKFYILLGILVNICTRGDNVKHLKELREEKKLSQQKLAAIINVSQQSIYKYENGLAEPDFATLKNLANYFDVSVDYLIDNTDIRQKYEHHIDEKLNDLEYRLVTEFRKLPNDLKDTIIYYASRFNEK